VKGILGATSWEMGAVESVPADAWEKIGTGAGYVALGVGEMTLSGAAVIFLGEIPVVDYVAVLGFIHGQYDVATGGTEEFQGAFEAGQAVAYYIMETLDA